MTTGRRPGTARVLRVAFLALLAFSTAQVVWWIFDQNRLAESDHARLAELYQVELELARTLLAEGRDWSEVAARVPHLELADGSPRVAPQAIDRLSAERRSRLRRYGWEGGFFLAVLIAAMVVVGRTIRAESELRRRQENFLAAVSHELKSPLASLQLSLETLQLRAPTPERLRELLERMRGDIERLDRLVTEVLDSASLESGTRRLDRQFVELGPMIAAVVDAFGDRARTAGVTVDVRVDGEPAIVADPLGVRTVIGNLLDNALRAAAGGRVEIRAGRVGDEVRLTIADDGVGFPPAEARRLFEKFYRCGDELRRTGRGTGLGLYIVERLMRLERGRVDAASAGPGRGATFTMTWPAAPARSGA